MINPDYRADMQYFNHQASYTYEDADYWALYWYSMIAYFSQSLKYGLYYLHDSTSHRLTTSIASDHWGISGWCYSCWSCWYY